MSESKGNLALVAIIADLNRGEKSQKQLVNRIHEFCRIRAVSSVYKRESPLPEMHSHSELVTVVQISSNLAQVELAKALSAAGLREVGSSAIAILLSLNGEISMIPEVTLPNPLLFQDRLILQCAAEVWGDYEHPVLGQTLNELVKSFPMTEAMEFFSQGKTLI